MILYFVNRNIEVLGLASTNLSVGYEIIDDELTESVDSGVATLTATVAWSDATRLQLEEWMQAGNYILTEHNNEAVLFTIITSETDTAEKAVTIYAEDAGLDLINEIAPAFSADEPHTIDWYISAFLGDSEFKIGTNEIPDKERTLSWDGASTVTERIRSIATQFDNAEISYSFDVENLAVTNKYINIWQKRGTDAGQELRLDRDINSFRVITSVEELYTGLMVTGGTAEGNDTPITLAGYPYDDGDIYVDVNGNLLSRSGAEEWGRMATGTSYIMGTYTYDTTSQAELCERAVAYLQQHKDPAVNYEVDIERGLEDSRIGDRINLVDDKGEVYISARILELRTSVTQGRKEAILGEYLIKSSGISERVLELAGQFQQIANDREFLYSISVSSSAGSYFINTKVDTVLSASVLYAGVQVTQLNNAVVKWYSGTTLLGTGLTYYVNNETTISIICRLERGDSILAEDYITLFSVESVNQKADTALANSSNAIVTDTMHYLATHLDSGVTIQTAGWTTTPQEMTATKKYLWTYHTYTKASGTTVDTAPVITGRYGADGVSISSIQTQYYLSTSSTALAGDSWHDDLPYIAGRYVWTREKITYSNGSVDYSTAIYNSALTNAQTAYRIASDTEQHFWMLETGTDTGAHITEVKQNVWNDTTSSSYHKGANLLLRSNGIAVRDGMDELATFSTNGVEVNQGGVSVASFGTTARIGKPATSNEGNVYVDSDSVDIRKGSTVLSTFTASGAELGANSTTAFVKMCGGKGQIIGSTDTWASSNDTFKVSMNNLDSSKTYRQTNINSGSKTEMQLLEKTDGTASIFAVKASGNGGNGCLIMGSGAISSSAKSDITLQADNVNLAGTVNVTEGRLVVDESSIKNLYGYNDTVSSKPNMYIGTTGLIHRTTYVVDNTSSKRFKHDIKDVTNPTIDPHRLYDIEVKQFRFNEDTEASRKGIDLIGFIAEQVEEVYPIAVDYDEHGQVETWREHYIIPPMLKLIQEQHEQIEELTKRIEAIERKSK